VIVISGALVLVSLVLLVLGVTQSDINLVYGCIVVSLVSLVFLILGIVQRRGEVLPGAAGPSPGTPDAAVPRPREPATQQDDPAEHPASDDREDVPAEEPGVGGAAAVAGSVLVVANRPRYHVGGCRYLAGKQAQEVDLLDAREAGFTPCGVCKPDAQLARTDGTDGTDGKASPGPAELPVAEPADSMPPSSTSSSERTGSRRVRAASPELEHEEHTASSPVASGTGASGTGASGTGASGTGASGTGTSAPLADAEHVVVVPDRNRYHRAECRHVRDAVGAETLTTAQAGQQGYSACGVCKP